MFLTATGLAAWSRVNLRAKRLSGEEWLKMSLGKKPTYWCKCSLRPANIKKLISASWDIFGTSELSYVGCLNHPNKWTVLIPTGNREIYFQESHVNLGNLCWSSSPGLKPGIGLVGKKRLNPPYCRGNISTTTMRPCSAWISAWSEPQLPIVQPKFAAGHGTPSRMYKENLPPQNGDQNGFEYAK